jgi:hypothetical protein
MIVRRVITAAALATGASAAVLVAAGPASADGCGTIGVPGQDTYQVCNSTVQTVKDLLRPS